MRWRLLQACLWHLCLLVADVSCEGVVQRLSPTSGSFCGGNRLSIYGSGFAKEASENRVEIGGDECKVESVSDDKLVCTVPFRDGQVVTGKESATELVSVQAKGQPLTMPQPLKFTFKAESAPIIVDWGPDSGQANDVLSFQGKDVLSGTSVTLGGRECKVKHAEDSYLQCVPPPREAGVSSVEVSFGPERGFACPGPKAPPLKFTYNLALQSALPSELGGDIAGPLDGGGQLTAGPCSPRSPSSTLVIVGQGLGDSTVFKLCGGDTWCTREGHVSSDPEMYHSGDWSFQTVACRPGPLDPAKAPGGTRKCDLTAEGADGMFIATLPNAWTYGPPVGPSPAPAPAPAPKAWTWAKLDVRDTKVNIGGAPPAAAPAAPPPQGPRYVAVSAAPATPFAQAPAAPPLALAPAPALALAPAPSVAVPPPVPTGKPQSKAKKQVKRMAQKVLSKVFENIADALSPKSQTQSLGESQLPPPHPASEQVVVPTMEPPPPLPPPGLEAAAPAPGPVFIQAEALLQDVEAALKATPPLLRGARRQL